MSRLPDRLTTPGMKKMAAQYTSQLSTAAANYKSQSIKRVVIRVLVGIASGPVPEVFDLWLETSGNMLNGKSASDAVGRHFSMKCEGPLEISAVTKRVDSKFPAMHAELHKFAACMHRVHQQSYA